MIVLQGTSGNNRISQYKLLNASNHLETNGWGHFFCQNACASVYALVSIVGALRSKRNTSMFLFCIYIQNEACSCFNIHFCLPYYQCGSSKRQYGL